MDANLAVVEAGGGKHWTKTEIEERKKSEPKLEKPKSLTAPKWLSREAATAFRKYAKLLLELPAGMITKLDVGTLARYCDCEITYATASAHKNVWMESAGRRLRELSEAAAQTEVADPAEAEAARGRAEKAEKLYEDAKAQVDYWIGQMMKLEKAARGCAASMGMTVADRCRLVIPQAAQPEEPDPLEALLARISGGRGTST